MTPMYVCSMMKMESNVELPALMEVFDGRRLHNQILIDFADDI
jgi:hypothetical protein